LYSGYPTASPSLIGNGHVRRAVADNAAVPRLATFYGIVIWMYRPDHPPPHFHAQYGDEVAQIELATLRVLNGSLPPRALRLVRAWGRLHTEELADNWLRAQELEPLAPIEPLP
jgi:hypothetical protein